MDTPSDLLEVELNRAGAKLVNAEMAWLEWSERMTRYRVMVIPTRIASVGVGPGRKRSWMIAVPDMGAAMWLPTLTEHGSYVAEKLRIGQADGDIIARMMERLWKRIEQLYTSRDVAEQE